MKDWTACVMGVEAEACAEARGQAVMIPETENQLADMPASPATV